MSDLVQQLRERGRINNLDGYGIEGAAADEIERLRNKLNTDSQHFELECRRAQIEQLERERDEARALLTEFYNYGRLEGDLNERIRSFLARGER